METLPHFREFSLHYLYTERIQIERRLSHKVESGLDSMFGFVEKGSVKVTLQDKSSQRKGKLQSGELFFIPPHVHMTIQHSERLAAQVILIGFQCHDLPGTGAEVGVGVDSPAASSDLSLIGDFQLHSFRMPNMGSWIHDFLMDGEHRDVVLYYQLQSNLYAMAAALISAVNKPKSSEHDLIEYMQQVKQTVLERYDTSIDMDELARLSGLSPSRFYQVFRKHTGLTPHKYLTTVRLNKSLSLLSHAPSSIMEVAHLVGYTDELYFSRLFKRHMGLTPTEYMNLTQVRIASLTPIFKGNLAVLGLTPVLTMHKGWVDQAEAYLKQIELSNPELILSMPLPDDVYTRVSEIAPVIVIPWKSHTWKDTLSIISDHLGLSTVGERWLSYYDNKVDNARFHIRQHLGDEPFLLVSSFEEQFRVYGLKYNKMRDLFYDELHIQAPAAVQWTDFQIPVTFQEVADLDCNHVIFLIPDTRSMEFCAQLEEEWRHLKQNGRKKICFFLRFEEPLLYNASVRESLMDQMVNQLLQYNSDALRKSP